MSEFVGLVGILADVSWKVLCALGVVALALSVLDRRPRKPVMVRVEQERRRRAA